MARKFSREFKLQAVQRVIEEDRSIAEVARELGVNPNSLQRWKQEYLLQDHPGPLPKETPDGSASGATLPVAASIR